MRSTRKSKIVSLGSDIACYMAQTLSQTGVDSVRPPSHVENLSVRRETREAKRMRKMFKNR